MALKFTQKNPSGSGTGGTYDHSLMINRGLPDQHTIESITGLREALSRKYEKPLSGIPRSDLAFDVATLSDIDNLRRTDIYNLNEVVQNIINEIIDARGDKDTLREYIDSKVSYDDWSGNGGTGSHDGNDVGYPLYQEFRAAAEQTVFNFTQEYRMGTRQLEVYLNGLRMVADSDYIETSESSIEFTFPMELDDHVIAMVRSVISSGVHEEYIATARQKKFTLSNPYAIYQNILQVYRNGVLQRKGRDYRELTQFVVEFYNELEEGDTVTFHQAGSTDPIAGVILESEIGRLKMSNAEMTILVQELSGNETTNMLDMYVDTFLTDNAFDKENSFEFILDKGTIKTGQTHITKDTYEDFRLGISAGTDYSSLSDRVVLANTNGGSEGNTFSTPTSRAVGRNSYQTTASIILPNRSRINLFAEKVEMGNVFLHVEQLLVKPDRTIEKLTTDYLDFDGNISNIRFATLGDEAHIVFTHTNDIHQTAVYYFTATATTLSTPKQITEYVDLADNASVSASNNKVVIVFDSERIQSGVRNVEYVSKTTDWSGIIHVTSDTVYPSRRPDVVISGDEIYVIYDTVTADLLSANIRLTRIDRTGVMTNKAITSLNFDNTDVKMVLGTDGIFRIAWLSNRLSANKGVDFAFIYGNGDISGTRTVMSPTSSILCEDIALAVDYQGVAHIAITVNERNSAITNIVYSYVTEGNVVTNYGSIIHDTVYDVVNPSISVIGDQLIVGGHTNTKHYVSSKSLANYLAVGFYTAEFDGLSSDTVWMEFIKTDYIPSGTSIDYEIRVSNDRYMWSSWEGIAALTTEKLVGQYVQIRAHMKSNYVETPEILSMKLRCEPNMIRVQTNPRNIGKDIQNCIVMADYTGDIKFFVSRDSGETFVETLLNRTTNLLGTPSTQTVVLRAEIQKGSTLKSWALIW